MRMVIDCKNKDGENEEKKYTSKLPQFIKL